jgi:choline dehydrogenase
MFTREEVARHATADDCWIVIGDRVYDVSAWLQRHPGRPAPILALAGMDATAQFRHFHSKEVFAQYAGEFEIGEVVGGALAVEDNAAARWHEGTTEVFDYVVVGAGSAGCLMTRRLCQAGFSVCLLEAGGSIAEDSNDSVNDPMKYGASFGTSLNWGHATVAQPGAGGRHIRCTRGRGVGGCSLVNGMLYNRGAREIYDIGWGRTVTAAPRQVSGSSSESESPWSAEHCLPYFKAHEDNSRGSSKWHGSGGEVRISDIPDRALSPIAKAFHTAAQQAGHDPNPDQNSLAEVDAAAAGGAQLGVQIFQCFVDERIGDGRRMTASRAFLPQGAETSFEPAEGDGGRAGELALRSDCTAAEIVLDELERSSGVGNSAGGGCDSSKRDRGAPGCRRARGVRYLTGDGAPATATARQEVVVCAGVIGSPHLLLLSGIGPRSAFERPGAAGSEIASQDQQNLDDKDANNWKWPKCKVCPAVL